MDYPEIHELFGASTPCEEFADAAQDLLERHASKQRMRAYEGRLDRGFWSALASAGWIGAGLHEDSGGLGVGIEAWGAIGKTMGRSLIPEPFIGNGVLPAALLSRLPSSLGSLLSSILDGSRIAAFAWQEDSSELSPISAATSLSGEDGRLVLKGEKNWVMQPREADCLLVHARQDNDPVLIHLPLPSPGVDVRIENRIDGTVCAHYCLDLVIMAEQVIARGEALSNACTYALNVARLTQAQTSLGIAQYCFAATKAYLSTRVQFGKVLASNQALQHRLVDDYIKIASTTASLLHGYANLQSSPDSLAEVGSRLNAQASELAVSICRNAVQLHGAIGYTDELDIGLYLKHALNLGSLLGSAPRLRRLSTAELISRQQASATVAESAMQDVDAGDLNELTDAEFKHVVSQFLANHYPDALRHVPRRLRLHECRDWYMTLSKKGWLAPAWPREYGGLGLSPEKLLLYFEVLEDYGVARLPDQGIINLGPVLIKHGTQAQKNYYLPRILAGTDIWCQGYSEPNAGSDLASLRTEAIPDGDDYIVNGSKIWTTLAHDADFIFALVRTDKAVKQQAGITFLLVDLKSAGISIRPITNLMGEQEFCEVFFDNVRVPMGNVVGKENDGWKIAKDLLGHERIFAGSPQQSRQALSLLEKFADKEGLYDDAEFRAAYGSLLAAIKTLEAYYSYFAEFVKRGESLPPSVSALKILATETYVQISRELARWADTYGGCAEEMGVDSTTRLIASAPFLQSLVTTIYGGTNEIQRNILSKAILKLPA